MRELGYEGELFLLFEEGSGGQAGWRAADTDINRRRLFNEKHAVDTPLTHALQSLL